MTDRKTIDEINSDDPIRADRLTSLGVLLTRVVNGVTLTTDEAKLLVAHIDTEVRESTTARQLARRTPASTAPAAAAHPLVKGRCPACNGASLFLGSGGYVTCARLDCPDPSAADDLLHRGRADTTTTRVFAALHQSAEQDVTRVIDLYEQWVNAGPPPLGVPFARWWDKRLAELHDAIRPADEPARTTAKNPAETATQATGDPA